VVGVWYLITSMVVIVKESERRRVVIVIVRGFVIRRKVKNDRNDSQDVVS